MESLSLTVVISSLARGGAERAASLLASGWAEQGKKVTVLTFDQGEEAAYSLHPLVKRRSLDLLATSNGFFHGLTQNFLRIRALRRAIRDSKPDIVISFMDRTNVLTLLATWGLDMKVVVSEQTNPSGYDLGIWNTLRRHVYPRTGALVCPTNPCLAQFQAMMQVRGHVIPNPFAVPAGLKQRNHGRQRDSPVYVLIAMGRLVPEKGFDLLLNSFARIADRHPDWSLTILGKGPLGDGLQKQAGMLGLTERIHFAGELSDPFPALAAADLFVFPSRFEGFGLALCEAMACGLPAVSFDCPSGPADIIRPGVDGILVPPQDIAGLAAALDRLMSDTQERERLASRAPEVLERFSSEKILQLWEQIFREL